VHASSTSAARVETATVPATTMDGHRTTLNGHFRKRMAAAQTKEIR
jgi:hypothetical protein